MPTLGNALDFAKYEARNLRAHILGAAPSSPLTGQLYFNSGDNTLYWFNGTVWVSASGGAPSGAAGGDLTGTYPNPSIAPGVIVNADVSAAAAIAYSKLVLTGAVVNADIAAAAAIARSKLDFGTGLVNADISASAAIVLSKLAVDPLARTNHTGTQLAATISNFDTQVRTSTLNQMAAPITALSLNSQKIIGMADGTAATDGATKGQVDAVVSGLDVKASCRAASTANVTLPPGGTTLTIDGVALANNDRVLLKDQTTGAQNGIYVVSGIGTSVVLTRSADADTNAEVTAGLFTFVSEGTVNADTGWYLQTNNPIVLGTTALVFVQFSGAGQIVSGAGLTKTGNTLDVGAGAGITVAADTVSITSPISVGLGGTGATVVATARTNLAAAGYYSTATHGAGTTITVMAATHGRRASRGLQVQVQDEAVAGGTPGSVVLPDIVVAANGDVTVTFGAAVTANTYRVTVVG